MAHKDDGGGGGAVLFEPHDADGAAVCQQGAAISATATGFGDVGDDVRRSHNLALDGLEGDIRPAMQAAVFPVLAQAENLQRAAEVGGAAVTMFGIAVGEFNRATTARNRQIEAKKTPEERRDVYDRLLPAHRGDQAELERAAADAARILRDPQSARSIKELWRAGLLPASTRALFDHVDLPRGRKEAMRRHLATLVRNGTLPADVLALDPRQLADYLERHPSLAAKVSKLDLDDLPADVPGADLKDTKDPRAIRRILNHLDPEDAATLALLYSKDLRNTNGVPFHLRTLGNKVAVVAEIPRQRRKLDRLRDELADLNGEPSKEDLTQIKDAEKRLRLLQSIVKDDRQILLFKPDAAGGDGHIAELHGTIEKNTRNLALLVPGTYADMDDFDRLSERGRDLLRENARQNDGRTDMAAISWLGGDMPDSLVPGALTTKTSEQSADVLAEFTHEVRAETDARAGHHVDVTAIGHSYGGATVGLSEKAGADVDRVLHVSSAGMGHGIDDAGDVDRLPDRPRFSLVAPGDVIDTTNGLSINSHGADPGDYSVQLPAGRDGDGEGLHGQSAHGGVFGDKTESFDRIYEVADGKYDDLPHGPSDAMVPKNPPHIEDRLPPRPLLPPELGATRMRP